jgi:hypothetical protein
MKPPRPIRGLIWQTRFLLRVAGLLVPMERRRDWYERWCADVWHWAHFLYESGRLNIATRLELFRHVWGAFSDGLWQRVNRDKVMKLLREGPRTPRFCLLTLAILFFIAFVATGFAPTIRSSFSRLPYKNPEHLAYLSFNNNFVRIRSDSLFLAASRWATQTKSAEAVSAFSWESDEISAAGGPVQVISARVSPDFFGTLGVAAGAGRLFHSGDEKECPGCIVISHGLWLYGFHKDPAIIGKQVVLQGRSAKIAGVLRAHFWFTSPEISVWTLTDFRPDAFTTANRSGVVLRLRPSTTRSQAAAEFSSFATATSGIEVGSISALVRQGTDIYLLFTMLALIGSLALLAFRLVNSSSPKVHLGFRDKWRWWAFFALKVLLLLADCFLISLEGTRRVFLLLNGVVPTFAGPLCTWLFLVTTVLALSWALRDQCRRCRLCLKRLGHEISVGAPAYLLLDWWGTELVCSQGHGMLHVPEMQASWMEVEHWTPLDDSWKPLFESEDVKA